MDGASAGVGAAVGASWVWRGVDGGRGTGVPLGAVDVGRLAGPGGLGVCAAAAGRDVIELARTAGTCGLGVGGGGAPIRTAAAACTKRSMVARAVALAGP